MLLFFFFLIAVYHDSLQTQQQTKQVGAGCLHFLGVSSLLFSLYPFFLLPICVFIIFPPKKTFLSSRGLCFFNY